MRERFFVWLNRQIQIYQGWVHNRFELKNCYCYWCERKSMMEDFGHDEWDI